MGCPRYFDERTKRPDICAHAAEDATRGNLTILAEDTSNNPCRIKKIASSCRMLILCSVESASEVYCLPRQVQVLARFIPPRHLQVPQILTF